METKGCSMSEKEGLVKDWKPVCAVCQFMMEGEKEVLLDDDGCDCRTIKKRKKCEDDRFMCLNERHLKLNYITGEKSPSPCSDFNRHGACREFVAIVPEPPIVGTIDNVVTITTAVGSFDGTRIFYTTDLSDPRESETVLEYTEPFPIDGDVTVTAVSVLANSVSGTVIVECRYV